MSVEEQQVAEQRWLNSLECLRKDIAEGECPDAALTGECNNGFAGYCVPCYFTACLTVLFGICAANDLIPNPAYLHDYIDTAYAQYLKNTNCKCPE